MSRRVAVTGLGVVSPLGNSVEGFWRALLEGRSGYGPVRGFDPSGYRTSVGGEVSGLPKLARAYALEAARQALQDSGARLEDLDPRRAGVVLGTTSGESVRIETVMDGYLDAYGPAFLAEAHPFRASTISASVATELGLRGPCLVLATACAGGNTSLAYAYERLSAGAADLMLAGGADVFNRGTFAGFNRLLATAPRVCAPFSKGRAGLIPAEGAAVLVLEDLERAAARGARVYAELLGYGLSCDARHVIQPDPGGVARSIAACLEACGLEPGEVDYISAHGTGTPANDRVETAAVKAVLGAAASRVPISSIKSMLGHSMGAASAMEAVACCLALRDGRLPPTAHLVPGDPDCDLDYVPRARPAAVRTVLSNAFAFGGGNAVVGLRSPSSPAGAPRSPSREPVAVTGIGVVRESDPAALAESLLSGRDVSWLDEPMAYALCGVKRALDAAGLPSDGSLEGAGIVLDVSTELQSQLRFYRDLASGGPSEVEPRLFPIALANASASRAAIAFGLRAACVTIAASFAGGENAVIAACDLLRRGGASVVLAGVVGEGACLFVLEPLARALERGAAPLARVESFEEGFEPGTGRQGADCLCLAKAVEKVAASRAPLAYEARGRYGSVIRLRLAPAPGRP